jgi:WXXGXW repeat (2 copies)
MIFAKRGLAAFLHFVRSMRRKIMRKALISSAVFSLVLLAGAPAKAQVSFGVQIGEPPAPRAYRVPARPRGEFVWVEGYWYPQGNHYRWRDGYWARPPVAGGYWIEPYYYNGRYVEGYWEGPRGRRWDRDRREWRADRRNDYRR